MFVSSIDSDHIHLPRSTPWTMLYSTSRYFMPLNERQCIFKSKAPDCSGAFALEVHPPLERMSVLFAAFRSSHVIVVETNVALTDGFAASPLLARLRVLDPVVMPFSCFVFLPEVAPGPTFPSLEAPGAGWL
jgi:hypothetical protein